ncbi:pseudaminic acid cytidylyltransferase [Polynucleobacter paneuropaeus]|nr:pseudaminic acid cytidylyltransferase [Polynucleobacter paneuropaeus]
MNIAIIPARGGSKRIPNKNIRDFCGEPIIGIVIKKLKQSKIFGRIIVSTDSENIAKVALAYEAEVPFIRPSELSDDHVDTVSVISHAVSWLKMHDQIFERVCCVNATAVLMDLDILKASLLLMTDDVDYAFPVVEFEYPIQRALKISAGQSCEMFSEEHYLSRSQDLTHSYHDAGQFYWGSWKSWLEKRKIFCSKSKVLITPRLRAQDIDVEDDWIMAEIKFKYFLECSD